MYRVGILAKMTCMILHDLASIWQDVLAILKSCKNLAKFHARFWQDNVRQEIAKTSYINLVSFLQNFGKIMQAVQTRYCQDVLQDSCQVSCKIKVRILHDS